MKLIGNKDKGYTLTSSFNKPSPKKTEAKKPDEKKGKK